MEWVEIHENWDRYVPKFKAKWSRLTDDDMSLVEGRREILVTRLQHLYDLDRFDAAEWVDNALAQICDPQFGNEQNQANEPTNEIVRPNTDSQKAQASRPTHQTELPESKLPK